MNWVVADETPTASVVWMAAEQIGKAQSHEQLQKICDYLVSKHWFQTAGDLRSARRETAEWQVLEVPGRLKLAIQQVLDQTAPHLESVPTYGYEDYYAAVRPSLTPGGESEVGTQQWTEDATGYASAAEGGGQVAADYYAEGYVYPSSEPATDSSSGQYNYGQAEHSTFSTNPPSYDETYGVGHEGYYSSTCTDTASGYQDSGEAAATLLSLQGSGEHVGGQIDGSDVVEAHTVDAEVAAECVEGELANDQSMNADAIEHGEPSQTELGEVSGNWSCGQCTFLNPMTSSFCEMCIGHISLSPDVKTATGTSVSASLLIPAKPVVEVALNSQVESPVVSYSQPPQPSLTCMLPPVGSLYPPSAPEYDADIHPDDSGNSAPLPPPPPYPGTSSCGSVDFLALAFSGSTAPKSQATGSLPTPKSSQMRREEATTFTEYTF
ncbi:hypothetical protein KRP22_012599 [Phytophthora ramorum]|nr:hypothetical protein KRP22_13003 [Phytophthora ramorum]